MEKFFTPRSIVVFGASVTKMNLGQIVLLNNKQIGYQGNLYGVGSQEGDVGGVHIYQKVADLPEVPDVAIFLTPAKTVPGLMEECGQKGDRAHPTEQRVCRSIPQEKAGIGADKGIINGFENLLRINDKFQDCSG